MYQPISKIVCVLALCCTTPLYANDATDCKEVKFQATDQAWTGHYYLQGVMEVGSELLLQDHGKFKWYLAVGSLDQYAEGTWWKNGNCIGLKALPKYTKQLEIFPTRLNISKLSMLVLKFLEEMGQSYHTYYSFFLFIMLIVEIDSSVSKTVSQLWR